MRLSIQQQIFHFFRGGCVGPSHKTVGGGVFSIECVFASILKSGKCTGLHTNTHLSYHLISYCHTSGHSKIFYMTTMNHFNSVTICTSRIQINFLCQMITIFHTEFDWRNLRAGTKLGMSPIHFVTMLYCVQLAFKSEYSSSAPLTRTLLFIHCREHACTHTHANPHRSMRRKATLKHLHFFVYDYYHL